MVLGFITNLTKAAFPMDGTDLNVRLALLGLVILGLGKVLQIDVGLFRIVKYLTFASNPKKYGKWAVVTGSTDGIGLAMAGRLASRGLNVVVMGRTQDKIDAAITQIKNRSPKVEVKGIVADMGKAEDFAKIESELKTLEVGVLVNNVGRSYDYASYLHEVSDSLVDSLIQLNVVATTKMTRLVLPAMLERKRGAIINVSSAAGSLPCGDPLYAVYSGTKAYVDAFSVSLHNEYKRKGIFVQAQIPYFVASKLSKLRASWPMIPSADAYAKAAVNAIGSGAKVVPYWSHAVQDWLLHALPVALVTRGILSHHFGIMARAQKKRAKQAAEAAAGGADQRTKSA